MIQEEYENYLASKIRVCILCNATHTVATPLVRGLFCPSCETPRLIREADRVRQYVSKAKRHNLPSTLTILEWLHILDHFQWKCAYGNHRFELLEHIVSMTNGGGTTALNCVPACRGCNTHKDHFARPSYDALPQERIDHVQNELLHIFA